MASFLRLTNKKGRSSANTGVSNQTAFQEGFRSICKRRRARKNLQKRVVGLPAHDNSSSHPSPTFLPFYLNLIAHLRSPVSSYITVKGANLTLDDKRQTHLPDQPTKRLSSLSSAVKDDDSKAKTATDLLVISTCTVSLLRCWLPKADSSI
jgi:hypothetical protein